jgi:hypothetical protein
MRLWTLASHCAMDDDYSVIIRRGVVSGQARLGVPLQPRYAAWIGDLALNSERFPSLVMHSPVPSSVGWVSRLDGRCRESINFRRRCSR